ncbi:cell division protein DamX [Buttiauxella selenatireducens]|uniref:Cell division protein DamX n=1 Tax=Buttiauxella selenatireducens TaxID=3073902 RepID=A0ABY9SC35_9ENTR|nr:cell division protein DamX [Buttiauxella sp. R73]WMY74705.1 cell division protein DamX [Buttiauxella sp. R73]
MDEFKPEDELKPDPSDRRSGRTRRADERESEPQINVDDVELDADEPRPARSRRTRDEEEYESEDDLQVDAEERRPARARKKSAKQKVPVSRQHLMMGIGVLVLLLLIIGIGSALKAPSTTETADQTPGAEKNIDLSGAAGNTAEQTNGSTTAANQTENATNPQEVTLPAISSTPTDAQTQPVPQGQQRVEVPGDLNNALTQQSGQIDNVVSNSTLPTAPATVAAVAGSNSSTTAPRPVAKSEPTKQAAPRQERKTAVIEPQHKAQPAKQQPVAKSTVVAEPKPVVVAKRSEAVTAPAPTATAPAKAPVTATAPKATATETATSSAPKATTAAPVTAATGAVAGDAGAIKGAPGSHYTLQLSSSSNSANLNAWAKKENLQHYMVYQTVRNGQPWYVLVSGIYASKDEAKRAVATLPADVQAKNPWAKPIHQVQSDLK